MIDFATLSITVKRDDVPKATAELDKLTAAGDRAEKSTQKLASANNTAGVSSVAATRNMGAWAAMQAEASGHVGEHSLAIGRLERALASSVGHFAGASSAAELLASGLLKFSVGTLETVGVLGGLALVIGLYEKMTEGAREAKKQMDDMTDSLLKQARAAEEATVAGRRNLLLIAEINQQTANKESGIGWRSILGSIALGHPFVSGTDAASQEGRRQDTADAVTQARKNLAEAEEEARRKELERLKKIDEERAKQQALLIRYNEMMEKAYGGTFDISPDARGPRSTWRANGQTMSDDERAAINKSLGLNPNGSVVIPPVSLPNVNTSNLLPKEIVLVQQLNERYEVAIRKFRSMDDVLDDFRQGIKQAATGLLEQFSPSNIAQQLAGGLVSQVEHMVSGLIGNAVGGVRHLLFGDSGAEKDAARQAEASARAMALQLDAVTKALGGDQLGAALDALKIGLISSLQAINEALPGSKNEAQRNAARTLAQQQEAEQEARVQKQFAEQKQYAQEDLQVRLLKATGQGSAADLQAFKNTQAREMQAALDANKDATYLNTLKLVQNNELLAFLNGTLSDAVRNAPSGFYGVAGYAGAYATPRGPDGYPTDGGTIGSDKTGWMGGGNRSKGSSPGNFTLTFQPGALVVDKNGMMNVVLEKIDIAASGTGGAGTSRSAALDTMTRK